MRTARATVVDCTGEEEERASVSPVVRFFVFFLAFLFYLGHGSVSTDRFDLLACC